MLNDFDSVKAFVDEVINVSVNHYMGVCTFHSEVIYYSGDQEE